MNVNRQDDAPKLPRVTPLHLELLLGAHVVGTLPNWASMAVQQYAKEMVDADLIQVNDADPDTQTPKGWEITPRGRAWLSMLMATPLPVPAFIDPRTSEALS